MALLLNNLDQRASDAVAHYWQTLTQQGQRQQAGDADRGGRAAVTGGRQMDGFAAMVRQVLLDNGLDESFVITKGQLSLPGYFRATKSWDMLVVRGGLLVAAIEFKSQRGPSFGNNFNNRAEEAIGTAHDLWTAYREEAFGHRQPRPWLGWLMLVEDCPGSTRKVGLDEPHFEAFPEFKDTSYLKRYELLLRKLRLEKLYDGLALVTASAETGPKGLYQEPVSDLSVRAMLASLAGHVAVLQAGT